MTDSSTESFRISDEARTVLRALMRTRQIRQFRPDPVPEDLLTMILEVARWTGSASNRQPWTFLVLRDPEDRRALAELAPNAKHVAGAPLAVAIVMSGEKMDLDAYDEARATERILIAAEALGLGAGIGWVVASRRAAVVDFLGLQEPAYVRTLISIGYPTEEAKAPKSAPGTARKPLDDLVRDFPGTSRASGPE